MEYKCTECYRCRNFLRYYTKGVKQYNQTKFGWCGVKRGNVSVHEGCEQFVLKTRTKKSRMLLGYYLENLLTEISFIRMILEQENNESNDYDV